MRSKLDKSGVGLAKVPGGGLVYAIVGGVAVTVTVKIPGSELV